MALDSNANIFQNLNGAAKHVILKSKTRRHLQKSAEEGSEADDYSEGDTNFDGDDNEIVAISLWNNVTKTRPLVLHANGPSKVTF